MIRGLFTAASGMLAGERRQDVISNNLANVNTTGYKADTSIMRSFPEMLLYSLNDHTGSGPQAIGAGMPNAGAVGTGAFLEETLTRFTPGTLKPTSNKYGFAIVDRDNNPPNQKSFFLVTDGQRSFVTRDGDFHADKDGFLVNAAGYYAQGFNATVQPPQPIANSRVRLAADGTTPEVVVPDAAGQYARAQNPQFTVVDVQDVNKLQQGENAFDFTQTQLMAGTGDMKRGFVEASNVDMTSTMTDMITVMRTYEANQHVIRTLDSTLDKAVNSLGRL